MSTDTRTAAFADSDTRRPFAAALAACTLGLAAALVPAGVAFAQPSGESPAQSQPEAEEETPTRNIKEWHTSKKGLGLKGYDPVAYFPEGGGEPTKGSKSRSYTFEGVTYRFATQANLDLFKENPHKYEPAYGGWCAFAMSQGDKVDIDPKNFIVEDGRLFLFYKNFVFGNARDPWLEAPTESEHLADTEWSSISGEKPRRNGKVVKADA
ncbi:MAG: YHS domain-containing (seleno)protein [Planctomycetota bacterium]